MCTVILSARTFDTSLSYQTRRTIFALLLSLALLPPIKEAILAFLSCYRQDLCQGDNSRFKLMTRRELDVDSNVFDLYAERMFRRPRPWCDV